jgi:hypothetical protein
MDSKQQTKESNDTASRTAILYIVWGLSILAALVCIGLILPELVLIHQFHSIREQLETSVTSSEAEPFLSLLMEYASNLSNWRAVTGFLAGIGGVAVWVMGKKNLFAYGAILGAAAFALNLLMMISF